MTEFDLNVLTFQSTPHQEEFGQEAISIMFEMFLPTPPALVETKR